MAVTITEFRVTPTTFLLLPAWAIERVVTVDGIPQNVTQVAVFAFETDAREALTLGIYQSSRWED